MIDVVEVLHELTDEDVGEEGEDEDADNEGNAESLKLLIEALVSFLDCSLASLVNSFRLAGQLHIRPSRWQLEAVE